MYDPELPTGFQDADLEMAALQSSADRASRLRKRGICLHGWTQGPPGFQGGIKCLECGKVFANEEAIKASREPYND